MKTDDTMSYVVQTLCARLTTNTFANFDVFAETTKLFPNAQKKSHRIVDGWGNPIKISIQRGKNGYEIKLISSGMDGVMGTTDDKVVIKFLNDTPVNY